MVRKSLNLSEIEHRRWTQHYKNVKNQSDAISKVSTSPHFYNDNVDDVRMVLHAISCFRYSVFRSHNLYHFLDGVERKRGIVRDVLGALLYHGKICVYDPKVSHGRQYQRLFSLDEIPDVLRDVCKNE